MTKKIFTVSDVHGHYSELVKALKEAGFDENNDNHLLIDCGDWFDRGDESLEVWEYYRHLESISRAIILNGNHGDSTREFLEGPVSSFNWRYNGLRHTIDSFLGRTQSFFSYILIDKNISEEEQRDLDWEAWDKLWKDFCQHAREEINKTYPDLLPWLQTRRDYYMTKNYIFTHASIQPTGDWQHPKEGWNAQHWDRGYFLSEPIYNTDKKIVVGHFDTGQLRMMHGLGDEEDHSILYSPDNQKIFLDACTIVTKKVNVLVIEDEELIEEN